ncbi:hypothetical protein F2P81_019695 [Scophthalmus maximus]|uniref:Complex 1 LYR protein domain-containing protein n=1 Tax=Scophthalmus maximus TaxID=52904 RepID=A0A6A4S8R3_SCOMX|nr:hypothetical protein F2P81_019695 [Scophthalmus maximus]
MAASARTQVMSLYRMMLRESSKFPSYNYRFCKVRCDFIAFSFLNTTTWTLQYTTLFIFIFIFISSVDDNNNLVGLATAAMIHHELLTEPVV